MIKYGNKMIASVGHYLTDNNGRRGISLSIKDNNTYTETILNKTVHKSPYDTVTIGNVFNIKITDIKKRLIRSIFSNDDQIAIILNKDNSAEDKEMYDFMQEWRVWFGDIAKLVKNLE